MRRGVHSCIFEFVYRICEIRDGACLCLCLCGMCSSVGHGSRPVIECIGDSLHKTFHCLSIPGPKQTSSRSLDSEVGHNQIHLFNDDLAAFVLETGSSHLGRVRTSDDPCGQSLGVLDQTNDHVLLFDLVPS